MTTLFTRAQVAEALAVCPTTIYRWEKRQDCPVKPKRLKRNDKLRYTQDDIDALRAWMNEFETVIVSRANRALLVPRDPQIENLFPNAPLIGTPGAQRRVLPHDHPVHDGVRLPGWSRAVLPGPFLSATMAVARGRSSMSRVSRLRLSRASGAGRETPASPPPTA